MNKQEQVQQMTTYMANFVSHIAKVLPDDIIKKLDELGAQEDAPLSKVIYETIREFAKLNNFPIKGKLTRIPDEVEYDFNDQPHNCKRYVDEDFNEYGIHEDGFIVAIPCEKAWGFSTKEKSRIAAMIEKERMEARQRRGSYEW